MTGRIVKIRWTRHDEWLATLRLDDAEDLFGTADEAGIRRLLAADPTLLDTWETERGTGRGTLAISSVKTMNEPEILEQNEGQFYLYDDEDPPGVHTGPYPSRRAARDDWEAETGYQEH